MASHSYHQAFSLPQELGSNEIIKVCFSSYFCYYFDGSDLNMNEASENVAVELAAQGVIGKRVDEMESWFMMALDYMIQLADKDQDDKVQVTMETRPIIPDRKLLARLVLIREEARNMMGGGILDERNDRGFTTLPESEVLCDKLLSPLHCVYERN